MMRLLENLGIIDLVARLMFVENSTSEFWRDSKDITDEQKMDNLKKLIRGEKVYHEHMEKVAGIRESLFMFFRSKDDNLIYLISTLLLSMIKSKHISKEVRLACGLNMRG